MELARVNSLFREYELSHNPNVTAQLRRELAKMNFDNRYVLRYSQNNEIRHITLNHQIFDIIFDLLNGVSIDQIDKYGSDQIDNFDFNNVTNLELIQVEDGNNNDGGFFPYVNITPFDLTNYQIYSKDDKRNDTNCLLYALKKSKQFSKDQLETIHNLLVGRIIPKSKLTEIANALECCINLSEYRNDKLQSFKYGSGDKIIDLALYNDHYFINDIPPIQIYASKHWSKHDEDQNINKLRNASRYSTDFKSKAIQIVREIQLSNGFEALDYESFKSTIDYQLLDEQYKTFTLLAADCEYIPVEVKKSETSYDKVYFADFETTTDGELHKAYMVSYMEIDDAEPKCIIGSDCAKKLLNILPDNSLVYFHNLKYDYQQIFPHCNVTGICEKDGMIYEVSLRFYKKMITLRDSYKMISMPLRSFASVFGLSCKKEIMPYSLYTESIVNKCSVNVNLISQHLKSELMEEFMALAKDYIHGDDFFHIRYAKYYCNQDVKVLRDGFVTFRKWCMEYLNVDSLHYLTIASLADQYFIKNGCYDGVSQITGSILSFVQESVIGGRVMTKDNKKWHIKEKLQDFDGVSLYPSAMSRIPGFPIGAPSIGINLEADYYVVEIRLLSIEEMMDCPAFSTKNNDGIREWDHSIPNTPMIVDKFTLEDMITFHKAKFEVLSGVYWNSGFNTKITECIRNVFDLRLKFKKEKNPVEVIFKLLMNSAYGKTITKASAETIVFITGKEKFDKYVVKNFNMIKSWTEYSNTNPKWCSYKICRYVSLNKHKNRAHCGSMILSMSKRIVNEVIYAAKLSNCVVYYTDTDSTHIPDAKLDDLASMYEKLYSRSLIGKQLGQFHCDFSLDSCSNVVATETVLIDKKIYCDRIQGIDENGNTKYGYHFRCKGVSAKSIEYYANKHFNGNIIDLYSCGHPITFDLLCNGQIKFEYKNGEGVFTNKEFTRTVQF